MPLAHTRHPLADPEQAVTIRKLVTAGTRSTLVTDDAELNQLIREAEDAGLTYRISDL